MKIYRMGTCVHVCDSRMDACVHSSRRSECNWGASNGTDRRVHGCTNAAPASCLDRSIPNYGAINSLGIMLFLSCTATRICTKAIGSEASTGWSVVVVAAGASACNRTCICHMVVPARKVHVASLSSWPVGRDARALYVSSFDSTGLYEDHSALPLKIY